METKPSRSERIRQAARKGDLNGGMKRRVRKADDAGQDAVAIGEAVKISAPANLPSEAKHIGRPTIFSQSLADAIVNHIICGGHMSAVKEKFGIDPGTIWSWRKKHEAFDEAVARAEEARAELWSDQLIEIADSAELDPNDRRVRVETRWKVIGSLLYRRYGVKQQIDINQKIDVGSTAAGVLMRLTEQAKQARLEHQVIDITPSKD